MNWIVLPDEHPGRCKNLRPSAMPYARMRRCLDYEVVPHVCTFESENATVTVWVASGTLSPASPKPWVKPASTPADTETP